MAISKKRIMTEVIIENPSFNIKIGTLNKINPETIYLELGTFITPLIQEDSYDEIVENIEFKFRRSLGNLIRYGNVFEKDYICIFEVASNRIKINKKSFLSIQCHLKPKRIEKLNDIENEMGNFLFDLCSSLIDILKSEDFIYSKTKKKCTIYS